MPLTAMTMSALMRFLRRVIEAAVGGVAKRREERLAARHSAPYGAAGRGPSNRTQPL